MKISALTEIEGIKKPEIISLAVANNIKQYRKQEIVAEDLVAKIIVGDKVALSRAITIIESSNTKHINKANTLIKACLPYANNSVRIGITGVPGVGKSTFIEAFGKHLTTLGKKVAVLAIDPSSTLTHGSILGDKTRMEELVKDKNAFIRPSAAGDSLGGVARKTREAIILCEACGFDTIIIETVGVGQSETAVHSMVDFFLLLKIAGAGDELQGIKRGIMEMADAIVINKADGDNITKANIAKIEFGKALHLFANKKSNWQPKISTCSAVTNEGVADVYNLINEFVSFTSKSGYFDVNRDEQNQYWMLETINEQLKNSFYNNPVIEKQLEMVKNEVFKHEISPFSGAQKLLDVFKNL